MRKDYLLTPGPSIIPSSIRKVLGGEIIHHRTEEFGKILQEVNEGLKYIFCTQNPVVIFTSSGTGAMEAAVSNFLSSKDKVIVVSGGKFGQRWAEIAYAYGLEVIPYNIEWGKAPSPEFIGDLLKKNKDVKAVFTTLCETSTGTVYDIEGIASFLKEKDTILIVDAISGLGQDRLLTDAWGVDVVISGSQKGFMLPPGLAFLSVSKKAESFLAHSNLPKYYFDLKKALKSYYKPDTPFTPAISLIMGLREALKVIKKEGREKLWEKFARLSLATREAAKSIGLKIFSQRPSSSVTAVVSPQKIKSSELVKRLRQKYGVSLAGGQSHLKDKIFRIAHMGAVGEQELIICFSILEKGLREMGYNEFVTGASLKKLEEVLYA